MMSKQANSLTALIEEQASEWYVLINEGTPTEDDIKNFHNWLSISKTHQDCYLAFDHLWNELAELPEESYGVSSDTPKIKHYINNTFVSPLVRRWRDYFTISTNRVSIAYSFIALLGMIGLLTLTTLNDHNKVRSYHTNKGGVETYILEDGSTMALSADSRAEVIISPKKRMVKLIQGQAYFEITSAIISGDTKKPFVVHSGAAVITVIGTQFEVQKISDKTEVKVREGTVNVQGLSLNQNTQNRHTGVELNAGQQVAVIGESSVVFEKVTRIDSDYIGTWREGRLTYLNEGLGDIVDDLRRFHHGEVIIGNPQLAELKVTASLNIPQIKEMALMLEDLIPVRVTVDKDENIFIFPRP